MCAKFNKLPHFDIQTLLDNCSDTSSGLELIPYDEYLELVSHLTNNKASGKSGIKFEAFKYSPPFLLKFIYKYFQISLQYGTIPVDWLLSLIHAILKPNKTDPSDINNHRPISLSECMRRLFTKCLIQSLVKCLPIDPHQFAYKAHHSVFDLTNILELQISTFKLTYNIDPIIIQSDITGAFDNLSRAFIMTHLSRYIQSKSSLQLI